MPTFKHLEQPEESLETLALLFKAMADPARLRILNLLAKQGELCNCHVEQITQYGNSKISRHFAYLKQVGLVQSRREGVWIFYSLKPSTDPVIKHLHQILDNLPTYAPLFQEDLQTISTMNTSSPQCG